VSGNNVTLDPNEKYVATAFMEENDRFAFMAKQTWSYSKMQKHGGGRISPLKCCGCYMYDVYFNVTKILHFLTECIHGFHTIFRKQSGMFLNGIHWYVFVMEVQHKEFYPLDITTCSPLKVNTRFGGIYPEDGGDMFLRKFD
jgi:hypothetical protein